MSSATKIGTAEQQKLTSVNPWLVPVFKGSIRLQKPPLPYWCAAILFKGFGESPALARLVPACLGALSSIPLYWLARRCGGRVVASFAVALWLSTFFIVDEHRKAMADPYLAFFSLSAICIYVSTTREPVEGASAFQRAWSGIGVLALYVSLALGALAKGPVVFLHFGVAAAAYSCTFRRVPALRQWPWHFLGMALFLGIALPWPIYVIERVPNVVELWRFESVGEFHDNVRNARPWHFYLPALVFLPLPWIAPWVVGLGAAIKRPSAKLVFPAVWMAASVLIFSFAHMKKFAYLLPIVPAFILISANGFALMTRAMRLGLNELAGSLVASVYKGIGLIFAVVIAFLIRSHGTIGLDWPAVVVALAAGAAPLLSSAYADFRRWINLQCMAFATLLILFLGFPSAYRANRRPPVAFADETATLIAHAKPQPNARHPRE